jgi:hypothetical protein
MVMHRVSLHALAVLAGACLAAQAAVADVLFDNSDNCSDTATTSEIDPSQTYYESRVADDFRIPARAQWAISNVTVPGIYFSPDTVLPAQSFNLFFYEDAGGLPGTSLCTYYGRPFTVSQDQFSIDLPSDARCTLSGREAGASIWISVQANTAPGYNTDWGWVDRAALSGHPAVVEYPGNVGCTTWGTKAQCVGSFEAATPDQCFALSGFASTYGIPTTPDILFGSPNRVSNGDSTSFYTSMHVVGDDSKSSRAADDFYVPEDSTWTVTQVAVPGKYFSDGPSATAASFNITFYTNGNGIPAGTVAGCDFAGIGYTQDQYVFTFGLPQPCALTGGANGSRYWVSVQANLSAGQGTSWSWNQAYNEFNSPAARQVPGGAAGPACVPWNSMVNSVQFPLPCSSVALPNLQFALFGVSSEIFRNGFDH